MWFSTSLFVFLFHHSWCSCVFWWILKWVSIFMFFVLIFTSERNSSARQTNSSLWCKIVWEWIYYEGPGFSLTQDSVVCLHWSERITKWTLDRKLPFGELHWKMGRVIILLQHVAISQKDQIKVWALQDNHVLPHGLRSRKKPAKEKPAIKVFIVPFPLQKWCKIYGGLWKYIGLQGSVWTIIYWTVWMWVCLDLHHLAKSWYEMRSVEVNACFNDHWFQGYECHYFMPWLFHHL